MTKKPKKNRGGAPRPPALRCGESGVEMAVHGDDRGTAERRQHDRVDLVDTYQDNRRARAARTVDTLGCMLRNGTIGGRMARDGRKFQALFHEAGLEGLRCMPLERLGHGGGIGEGDRTVGARREIAAIVERMGGHGAPAACALWFVLGCGYSIAEWAQRERYGQGSSMNRHTAKGILIGALSALGPYYDKRG